MATLGTLLRTLISGVLVGTDKYGNRYYRARVRNRYNRERRWVIYKGSNDASRVPAEWFSWLHHQVEDVPDRSLPPRRAWQKPAIPNMTGTALAYRPPGALEKGGQRAARATHRAFSCARSGVSVLP